MKHLLAPLLMVGIGVVVAAASGSSASTSAIAHLQGSSHPARAVAQAKAEWLKELHAAAASGDRAKTFPSPSRIVLLKRLHRAEMLYGFRIFSVTMLHPLQSAPLIVIRSDGKRAIAQATPKIIDQFDPHHPTAANPSGYAYEGYFFVAQTIAGVPYLATFNHWRPPHAGGGQWAAGRDLYPFPHS